LRRNDEDAAAKDARRKLEIRPYEDGDENGVVALWREVFPDAPPWNDPRGDIRRKLGVQRELFLVAVNEDGLVGTAMAGFDGHRGWVHLVAVSPRHRRRGIGAALMKRVERDIVRHGCGKLNLQVRETNRDVIEFYERLGYKIEDRVSMAKRLGADDWTPA
jgi:ribosomal protein S18 acetylase RimI-like enzyme